MVQGYHDYKSIWDNPLADGDLLCERQTGNSHDLQAVAIKKTIDGYPPSCWACAKENIFNLFDILKKRWQYYTHMRLHYRCLKIWMVKICVGQSSNFAKFSWYQSFPPYSIDVLINIKSSSAHIISLYCNNAQ